MNAYLILELLNQIIQIFLIAFLMINILKSKFDFKLSIIFLALFEIILFFISYPIKDNIILKAAIIMVLHFVLMWFCFKEPPKAKISAFCLTLLNAVLSQSLSVFVYAGITHQQFNNLKGYSGEKVIALVFYNMIFLFFSLCIIFFKSKNLINKKLRNFIVYVFFPISQLVPIIAVLHNHIEKINLATAIIGTMGILFCLIADWFLLMAMKIMNDKIILDEKLAIIDNQRMLELDYFNLSALHMKEMAEIRHEAKNQLQVAKSLLSSPEFEDKDIAKEILEFFLQAEENTAIENFCNNSVINTVLIVKNNLAKSLGVQCSVCVSIPKSIKIEKVDLCSLFCNLMDNAIEACDNISDHSIKKEMEVKASIISGYLVVKVFNKKQNPILVVNDKISTTKPDTIKHGFGLHILEKISHKYDGALHLEYDETSFTAIATLKV